MISSSTMLQVKGASRVSVEAGIMMVVSLARLLKDGEVVFHGVASPIPAAAVLLAKRTHAPNLVYLNITGSVDPTPDRLPESTVDPLLLNGTAGFFSLADAFDLAARGKVDTAFLSGVQIDRCGRINMSAIGDYASPKVRLPGGAGSAFLMETAGRVLLWRTRHDQKTFVDKVSFVTAAGRVSHVVTPLCIFAMEGGELKVESIHPHTTPEEVRNNTGFPVDVDGSTPYTLPPTGAELGALDQVDPQKTWMIEF